MKRTKPGVGGRIGKLLLGPILCLLIFAALRTTFSREQALTLGVLAWMICWWIGLPVHYAVTSLLPVVAVSFLRLAPVDVVVSQYFSETIVQLLGAEFLCQTWKTTGLGRRISLKVLNLVGPSMHQQICAWFFASVLLSLFLPKTITCAVITPIAVSMLDFVGEKDIRTSRPALPILLAIAWGIGIAGATTPLGGAMNLVSISNLESVLGHELPYADWVMRMAPMVAVLLVIALIYLLSFRLPVRKLEGTREFFRRAYAELGPMGRGERISLILFLTALVLSFARPLYADLFPEFKASYVFLACGLLTFVLHDESHQPLLDWSYAEKNVMWGMLYLYGGGLAIGKLMTESGTASRISELLVAMNIQSDLLLLVIFVVLAALLAETSSNTAAAAIATPVVLSITMALGKNPIPFFFVTALAANGGYFLPLSTRAVPVSYGMDSRHLLKKGLPLAVINYAAMVAMGYLFLRFWPFFGTVG